jgi:glycerol uptake facilitator-like aquaporin
MEVLPFILAFIGTIVLCHGIAQIVKRGERPLAYQIITVGLLLFLLAFAIH